MSSTVTVEQMVARHDKDLYIGNGKPGITTRLALLEDCTERICTNLGWITKLLVAAIVTGVGDLIVNILKHH